MYLFSITQIITNGTKYITYFDDKSTIPIKNIIEYPDGKTEIYENLSPVSKT